VCDDPKRPCTKEAIDAFVYIYSMLWVYNSIVVIGHLLSIIDQKYITIDFYFNQDIDR
jgi:hypothetical protein